jgi:hypothetical protein
MTEACVVPLSAARDRGLSLGRAVLVSLPIVLLLRR